MIYPFNASTGNAPTGLLVSKSAALQAVKPKGLPRFQGAFAGKAPTDQPRDSFLPNKKQLAPTTPPKSPDNLCDALSGSAGEVPLNPFLQGASTLPPKPSSAVAPFLPGFNPNKVDAFGDTLLMSASVDNDAAWVKRLIAMGAEVNAWNHASENHTALMLAIMAKASASVEALLKAPALDINLPDAAGNTPLAYAVSEENLEMAETLLAHGANPNLPNQEGLSPLALACQGNQLAMARRLLKAGADPNLSDNDGDTPLLIAIARDNPPMIRQLLKADANPNQSNQACLSPLSMALGQQNKALWEILRQHGARIDAPDKDGQTLLTRLCHADNPFYVNLLLQWGGDVNQPNALGITPLRQAILSRHPQVVAQLLAQPSLKELPDIQQAWQALKGEPQLSDQACDKLAKVFTAPFFVNQLQQNPEMDLGQSFKRFRRVSQNWQVTPRLQAMKRQTPQAYQQACAMLLGELLEADTATGQAGDNVDTTPIQLTRMTQEQESGPQNSLGLIPERLMTARPSNFFDRFSPPSTETVAHNLHRRLSELRQRRSAYSRRMQVDVLEQLFESHYAIREARQSDPAGYLLACQAFLGLTLHCFYEMAQNPELMRRVTPQGYQDVFYTEIAQTLENRALNPELNQEQLLYLLTRPIAP